MISFFERNTTEKDLPYMLFYDTGKESVPGHWHKETEIILCKSGSTKMNVNNKSYTLNEGEIGLALGGDIHSYGISENHRRTVIIFDLSIFEDKLPSVKARSVRKRLEEIARVSTAWDREIQREAVEIINRLERLNNSKEYGRTLDVWARLCDLVLLFCNKVPRSDEYVGQMANFNQVKMLEGMEDVFKFIEMHYSERIMLEDAAAVLNFNTSYFARTFKKITGTSFLIYLNTYRINRARQLLLNSNGGVAEIAAAVGFGSVKSFNRVFKQIIGTSPTEYRKNGYDAETPEN